MRKQLLLGAVAICALVGGGAFALHAKPAKPAVAQSAAPKPVVAAPVQIGTFPIELSGLGTVQAFNTVTIHTRVDGQIQSINFAEGQKVAVGDTLLKIDPRPFQAQLDQAVSAKARDEAQLANAQLDLKRDQALVKPGWATVQSYDTQKALVAQLQATIQNDQAQIEYAQVQLGYTTITSPIPGITGVRLVDVGNIVHATDTTGIVVVTQIEPISVTFTLPEKAIADIRQHMTQGPLKVEALSEDNRIALGEGQLQVLDNEVDPQSGMVRLKATFPNKDDKLWPGEFVNARLVLDDEPNALTVPLASIQQGSKGTFAYVVKPDMTVEQRPVQTGASEDGRMLVIKGLAAGDRVVVEGQSRLQPGDHVTIQQPSDSAETTANGEGS
jgi:membrane fusion protein, multidrug efflux system